MLRKFSPYEQNQLRTYGISLEEAMKFGDMPVEYITGHCDFYGRDFLLNRSILIPRVETVQIIDIALEYISSLPLSLIPYPLSLSDLGTGSGVLGITLFKELTDYGLQTTAYLSDISKDTLDVTRKNASRLLGKMYYNRSGRIRYNTFLKHNQGLIVLKSDLFSSYPKDLKFDLVVANLPYIPSSRIASLSPSVRDFEPRLALDGGPDGLTLVRKLFAQLPVRLKSHGVAILEIDETHKLSDFPKIERLRYEIKKDQFGKNRFVLVKLHGLKPVASFDAPRHVGASGTLPKPSIHIHPHQQLRSCGRGFLRRRVENLGDKMDQKDYSRRLKTQIWGSEIFYGKNQRKKKEEQKNRREKRSRERDEEPQTTSERKKSKNFPSQF